jgi:hypothetical protein
VEFKFKLEKHPIPSIEIGAFREFRRVKLSDFRSLIDHAYFLMSTDSQLSNPTEGVLGPDYLLHNPPYELL